MPRPPGKGAKKPRTVGTISIISPISQFRAVQIFTSESVDTFSLRPIFAISAELTPAVCCKSFFFISKSIRSFQSFLYEIISKCTHSVTSGLSEKRFVTYKKTRHHQDFYLNNAWFMFSNPARQMPYISNFRGLLFYDHPYRGGCFSFSEINKLILEY